MRLDQRWQKYAVGLVGWVSIALAGLGAEVEVNSIADLVFSKPLSIEEAINLALFNNPNVQRAQKTLEAEQGVIIETRAIALPKLGVTGNYSAVQESDVDKPPADLPSGFTFGTEQSWRAQIRLAQSLYEGGRILSSLRAARLLKERSLANYQTTVADVVLEIQIAYYAVLLAEQQISVQEASVQLLGRELTDVTRRFQAGTVPRFNVLRAEVELANARPRLSHARNQLRISRTVLAKALGANIPEGTGENIPLQLSSRFTEEEFNPDLIKAIEVAQKNRTELRSLRSSQALRKEDLVQARAGYKPSVQAFAGYDVHNSIFSDNVGEEVHGWMTGVQLQWDIFDGRRTEGQVKRTRALYELAGVELDDAFRRIELEVRTSYSAFIEAREVLESQRKVLEQAEEALRLATARSEAGTGTQLDVLSAQTALTDARSTQVQALHDYVLARARLDHAMGVNTPAQAP